MADCVFCKIVAGGIPSQKLLETDKILAIVDINPVAFGHALVIPKAHHATFVDLPADLAVDLMKAAQGVAAAVVKSTGAEGFNLLMNNGACSGQLIPHAHFHVIPRRTDDGVKLKPGTKKYGPGEIEKQTEAIRAALK